MNSKVYQGLLLAIIVASYFQTQAIVLGLCVMVIVLLIKNNTDAVSHNRVFVALLLPVLLGFIAGYQNNSYLILKDAYYFSMPVLFTLCGIMLARKLSIAEFLRTLVLGGACISVIVTVFSLVYMGTATLTDPYSARYVIGIAGTPGPPLAIGCMLLSRKFKISLFSKLWYRAFLIVNVFGVYMLASRTYFVITMCFVFLLLANHIKRVWITPAIVLVVMIFTLMPVDLFTSKSSDTFWGKMFSSFTELSMGDYNTEQDINIRYRGYESFMAINGYVQGDSEDMLIGGLGKQVDLKTYVRLGEDAYFRFIPVLHNGWLYILVKTGAVGVLIYLVVFFGMIIANWRHYTNPDSRPIIRFFAALTIGCILSLLFTNYIVTSFFNVEMTVIMLTLGFSHYYSRQLQAAWRSRQEAIASEYNYITDLNFSL